MLNRKCFFSFVIAVCVSVWGIGCTSSQIDIARSQPNVPSDWSYIERETESPPLQVEALVTPQLSALIHQALNKNYQLRQQRFVVEAAKQSAISTGADLWPTLDVDLSSTRSKSAGTNSDTYSTSFELAADLSYEVDVWGKLSAANKEANLLVSASMASYRQAEQQLIADVILAWFNVIRNQLLYELAEKQLKVTQESLDIIEVGYLQGLNAALDVYLARNSVASEQSNVANQRSTLKQSIRELELLIGEYPSGELTVSAFDIPLIENEIPIGLPSELVTRNPSLQANWLSLLAEDANVAYYHKSRFPSFSLSAEISKDGSRLPDIFSLTDLSWYIASSLSAPIFNAGSLKAAEEKALAELRQAEQGYLDLLYTTFASVENGLTAANNLAESYTATELAKENAVIAESLSLEQYRKGLVDYTTVLDSQTRSFTAQSSLINLKYQRLQNRVQLLTALGGDFFSQFKQDDNNAEN